VNRRTALRVVMGAAAVAAGGGIARSFGEMAWGDDAQRYLLGPADAGALVRDHPPAPGQPKAWTVGFDSGRVLAYYWDLPPASATERAFTSGRLGEHDLVVVDLRRRPAWFPRDVEPIAERGRYALVEAGAVKAALADTP